MATVAKRPGYVRQFRAAWNREVAYPLAGYAVQNWMQEFSTVKPVLLKTVPPGGGGIVELSIAGIAGPIFGAIRQ